MYFVPEKLHTRISRRYPARGAASSEDCCVPRHVVFIQPGLRYPLLDLVKREKTLLLAYRSLNYLLL